MICELATTFWGWLLVRHEVLRDMAAITLGLIGLGLQIWRSWNLDRQTKASQKHVDTVQKQLKSTEAQVSLAQRDSLNNRFQKACEMIGSEDMFIRMGGISAFRWLAEVHPKQYHFQVGELLCVFVRSRPKFDRDGAQLHENVDDDVQEALNRIRWLRDEDELGEVVYFKTDLHGAYLKGARLDQANLCGADLNEALLNGATLSRTVLRNATLQGADLSRATLNRADLSRSRLDYAQMERVEMIGAKLVGASAQRVRCQHTKLLNVDVSGCDLRGADLSYAVISGNLSGCRLESAILEGATIGPADLTNARLNGADLSDAVLCLEHWRTETDEDYPDIVPLDPVFVLTQDQLDRAAKNSRTPPIIYQDVIDASTGQKLKWNR